MECSGKDATTNRRYREPAGRRDPDNHQVEKLRLLALRPPSCPCVLLIVLAFAVILFALADAHLRPLLSSMICNKESRL